jgi:predicted nucleotidyltransferase component of viral defense system
MTGPSGATVAGARFLELRRHARSSGVPFDSVLVTDALEALLARLALSDQADHFVLKGGVLLAALDARRATRDIDLAGIAVDNEPGAVLALVTGIALIDLADGYQFDIGEATAQTIREGDDYQGVRVKLPARLATARIAVHVDVNVGDPIWPHPQIVTVPRVLGEPLRLRGYPVEMVLAEKIATAIDRGQANTRWRDLADIWTLTHRHTIDFDSMSEALQRVAAHRGLRLQLLRELLAGWAEVSQARWATWLGKQAQLDLPDQAVDAIAWLVGFADPLMAGDRAHSHWEPSAGWATPAMGPSPQDRGQSADRLPAEDEDSPGGSASI